MDFINKFVNHMTNPSAKPKPDLHLQASHGASLERHDPPDTTLKRLISNETTRQIRSQGNLGVVGMDALRDKAVNQIERVAERSRLQQAGLFEPHLTHDQLCHLSQKHRDVANGSLLFTETDSNAQTAMKVQKATDMKREV